MKDIILPKNACTQSEEQFCLQDIKAKNEEDYASQLSSLPYISTHHGVSIRKKKVEPAGFMFYVKYEIALLKGKKKKTKEGKQIPIEEIFLYKEKIDYLNELKGKNQGEEEPHSEGDHGGDYNKEKSTKNNKDKNYEDDYDDTNNMDSSNKKKQEKANNKKSSNLVKKCINNNINVYEVLSVEEADDLETIKASYKKLILLFHPDKNKGTTFLNQKEKERKRKKEREKGKDGNRNDDNAKAKGQHGSQETQKDFMYYMEKYNIEKLTPEEKKIMFLKIQDSYAVLSDKTLRKQYDSSIPFDEYIPTLTELEEAPNFYEFLRPVFKRNAKWSAKKPVPDIGDEHTDIKNVKYFYDFWYNFINWRDFSYQNEYNYEEAECREERRWMERENKKIQKKASKAENLRIIKLVDLAYNNDPRIIAENKRVKLEKQRKKELSILEKQKKIDGATNEMEKESTTNQQSNDKKNKDNKAAVKIWRHHIKSLCVTKLAKYVDSDLVQERLSLMPFETLCEFIDDIYVFLNFNLQKGNSLSVEKTNVSNDNQVIKQSQGGKDVTHIAHGKSDSSALINTNSVYENGSSSLVGMNGIAKQDSNNIVKKDPREHANSGSSKHSAGYTNDKNYKTKKEENNTLNGHIAKISNDDHKDNFSVDKDKQNQVMNSKTSFERPPSENNHLHHSKIETGENDPQVEVYTTGNKREDEQNEKKLVNAEKVTNGVNSGEPKVSDGDDSKRSPSENMDMRNNTMSSTTCSTASSTTRNQVVNQTVKQVVGQMASQTQNIKDSGGNRTTGFIGHLKNIELAEKEIELLILIFKKYINQFTLVVEKEQTKNLEETANTKNKNEKGAQITEEETINRSPSPVQEQVSDNVKLMNELGSGHVSENDKKKNEESSNTCGKWTAQEVSLLAKALKSYPGGTRNRWEQISNFIKTKSVKEVIKKTKEMFENETLKNLSRNFEETAFDNFKNQNKGVMKKIDDNLDKRDVKMTTDGEENLTNNSADNLTNNLTNNLNGHAEVKRPWTHQEQHLLEQALMKHPASLPKKERLQLVASEIKTRTLEEVILRMKTLRAQILAKKAAK
ncbi:DNA-binding chaperone, putative [Plasmodium knowlesi strain H]|uniref:DNA-binding chaperone, putative n=3 Tax=Plasmodium knowlesi TaxID=5850 RepID=A0A5K1VGE8_PLAKH|nr:DNA-binding chaperone, putative [Plasmodium knowlesi strain H]OTN64059.1 putative DNA-binding chaperone [Plasmodium knowlesi]CAA9990961.1 DNA-binding chaperone, putative [Plasmodium knowlesi strain H]SBO20808.1 DNA-binding chaperone, putative [Plasmodium knowlesi strain H]SBO21238.1 DNA-binding chaperone, putative [Plasmodium knowlesi strain H]VVS80435.1 DNA-binding chaperone, putative [Plasmodium knowlesi strain H]|eukprot:XP_002262244.1 dna-binding chaperone, putative [Plasmodium knowlesi strain H]